MLITLPKATLHIIIFLIILSLTVHAETGIHDDHIVFGQSAVLEGPTAELGRGVRDGILAAFEETNITGGVHGRTLNLLALDDGYEPERAITNVNRLINIDKVFAIIGQVGTPTSRAVQPITTEAGVPFLGPYTGADFLRDPSFENVINIRASYSQETESWGQYLVDSLGYDRIAILYQDDSFGRAGLKGLRHALTKRGLALVAEGTYMRNTTAVKRGLLDIRKAKPQAVAIVGAYEPSAEFIRIARGLGLNPVFINISFVGSEALAEELGSDGTGVIISQVVPLPEDNSIPMVANYNRAIKALKPGLKPSFVSLEGYILGRLVITALEASGPDVTRQSLLATIRNIGQFNLDGIKMNFGPNDNQGMDDIFLTELNNNGRFDAVKPVDH